MRSSDAVDQLARAQLAAAHVGGELADAAWT